MRAARPSGWGRRRGRSRVRGRRGRWAASRCFSLLSPPRFFAPATRARRLVRHAAACPLLVAASRSCADRHVRIRLPFLCESGNKCRQCGWRNGLAVKWDMRPGALIGRTGSGRCVAPEMPVVSRIPEINCQIFGRGGLCRGVSPAGYQRREDSASHISVRNEIWARVKSGSRYRRRFPSSFATWRAMRLKAPLSISCPRETVITV